MRGLNAGVLLAAGAMLLLGGRAAVADQSFSLDSNGTQSQTLDFSPFNATLGRLTEVDITLSNVQTSGYVYGSVSGPLGNYARVTSYLNADLSVILDGTTLFSGSETASRTCNIPLAETSCHTGEQVASLSDGSFEPDPVVLTDPADLALFLGTSDITLLVSIAASPVSQTCAGDGSCSTSGDATFSGTLDVTYQDVPEPASFGLLVMGLTGLGAVRRRSRG
jgi:PEP-CTERM motif